MRVDQPLDIRCLAGCALAYPLIARALTALIGAVTNFGKRTDLVEPNILADQMDFLVSHSPLDRRSP